MGCCIAVAYLIALAGFGWRLLTRRGGAPSTSPPPARRNAPTRTTRRPARRAVPHDDRRAVPTEQPDPAGPGSAARRARPDRRDDAAKAITRHGLLGSGVAGRRHGRGRRSLACGHGLRSRDGRAGRRTALYTRTPAFTGYLAEAQRNAIEKMLDRRVWGYWALENLWGNLRWNPDPADRENIMLTGYLGQMVGMYETLNDDRFSAPDALSFRWNDRRVYPNSFGTIAESVHRNMIAGDYTLYPCEPNWIYTVCNTFGLNTLLTHDRLHGTAMTADVIDRLHRGYESEFLRPDGRIIGVRSARLGASWNFWAGPAIQLTTALWLHAGLPEYAQRAWWLVRDQEIRADGDRVGFPLRASSRVDPGNYRLGGAYGQVMIASAAREMGDEEVARTALAGIEEFGDPVSANGVRYYAGLSGLGNMYALQFRFNRASGLRDQIAFGAPPHWRTGPVLADAAYPEVQVARAVTDGHALELVLRPGNGLCRTTVRIARLEPGRAYRVAGGREAEFTASLTGDALIDIDLGGRHEVHIAPR
ncbi:linalool dehydratase/isomerase domain-containing protein [Nocardia tengchongensis]|uniref:linalool dehydratase/isomerase domain-containing protein n=1 Tax=Nocardia tengchongensis TaxID=2055889 RepID=UPI0036C56E53